MIRSIPALTLILLASFALAKEPATLPAKPTPKTTPTSKPAPKAEVAKAGDEKFPSPAEIMAKIKANQAKIDKLIKVAHVDLSSPIVEKAPDFTLFGADHLITVPNLLDRLHKAREDKNIRAVLITLGQTDFNSSQALEIRSALAELRQAGKRTFVYADSYDTTAYLAASGATDVCILAGGEIMMTGVAIEPMFMKGLFDKLGVKADFIQVGEFKGADEQYTRTELSPEAKGELNKLADGLYDLITQTIAQNRNISQKSVKAMIDEVFVSARSAKDRKLVDHLLTQDQLRDIIRKELGGDINILPNYAIPEKPKLDFSNPFAMLMQMSKKPTASNKPQIALIHAEGVIVDGDTEDSLFGGSATVGSENIRKAFRIAARDENIQAIVLRIDSPGGSALASEVMWQAVHDTAKDKPVIISIGSMAASGGYYLASAGDHIIADPSAIVGSIGVVGGKFVLSGLFEKVGITTQSITRGANANLFSMNEEWSDRQKRLVTNWMKNTYDQFTQRVMVNRKGRIKDIDQVARGRIFLAKHALELGMVDEIGGLTQAINHAAKEVDLEPNSYEVKSIPGTRSIIDLLTGQASMDDEEARMPFKPQIKLSADSPLLQLPPAMRRLLAQQLQLLQLTEKRPVLLVSPYTITVK